MKTKYLIVATDKGCRLYYYVYISILVLLALATPLLFVDSAPSALVSQCIVESGGNQNAVSKSGALGYCQIMPNTWKEWAPKVGAHNPFNKHDSLLVGTAYMEHLRSKWTTERSKVDLDKLTWAAYNAGFGNIYKAQKLCGMPKEYDKIIKCLPQVTGVKNAKQTTDYVDKVARRVYGNR